MGIALYQTIEIDSRVLFMRKIDKISSSEPIASVIIAAYNSRQGLDILLPALLNQTLPTACFEVIVIDDGSSDLTADFLSDKYPSVRVISQVRGGAYKARCTGIASSRGKILAFTDADCLPDEAWLENGINALTHDDLDLVSGQVKVCVQDPKSVVQRYDARFNLKQKFYAKYSFGVTANLFVTKTVYERCGGFNLKLYSGGDQKFCQNAVKSGAKFGYLETCVVNHPARQGLGELIKKTKRVAKGRAQAFPKIGYYLPRILSTLPEDYGDVKFSYEPVKFKLRFVALHYFMEVIRIYNYAITRTFEKFNCI